MSSSKKEHLNITSVNDLPTNSLIQTIINDAAKKVDDEQASPCVCCSVCQEEDDEHNDAFSFVKSANCHCVMLMLLCTKRQGNKESFISTC
jgi:hypothetical protein